MKRKAWLNIHLVLVGFFLPLLIIYPLSGTAYLLGSKGSVVTEDSFEVDIPYTTEVEVIKKVFTDKKIDFSFEYVKSRGDKAVLRPATREHYEVHKTENGMKFVLVKPNWLKILQELHFGHGAKIMKQLQIIFGIAFFFVIISGFVLSWTMKRFKPLLLGTMGLGFVITVLAWNLF